MKLLLAMLAILALAQCRTTSKLPPPGEPVRKDLDERWRAKEAAKEKADGEKPVTFPDPNDQKAYDAGYEAGFIDHHRSGTSDPEPHMTGLDPLHRNAFISGYTAGFAK